MKTFTPLFVLLGLFGTLFTSGCATAPRSSYMVYYDDFDGGDIWCWDLRSGWYYVDEPDYWFTRRHLPVPTHRHGHDRGDRPHRPPHPGEPPHPGTRPCYYLVGADGAVKRSTDGTNFTPYSHHATPARAEQRSSPPPARGVANHPATPVPSILDSRSNRPWLKNLAPFAPPRPHHENLADNASGGSPNHRNDSIPANPGRGSPRDRIGATPSWSGGPSRSDRAGSSDRSHAPAPAGRGYGSGASSTHTRSSWSEHSGSSGGGGSSGYSSSSSSGSNDSFGSSHSSDVSHHSDSGHGRTPNEP